MNDELVSTWQVVGAAVQGVSHQKQDLPCQDALAYQIYPGGMLVIALADGAGSAALADQGARLAVETALESLSAGLGDGALQDNAFLEELVRNAFLEARSGLERLAEEQEQDLRSFATTLTCAVVMPDRLAIGQLGDGAVILVDEEGSYHTATQVQHGEYANETNFLTQELALDQVEVEVIEGTVRALAAMSDGLTRLALKMPTYEPHIPFFQPLFAYVEGSSSADSGAIAEEQMAAFLASERVCARTDDDKALVLAIRRAEDQIEAGKS